MTAEQARRRLRGRWFNELPAKERKALIALYATSRTLAEAFVMVDEITPRAQKRPA